MDSFRYGRYRVPNGMSGNSGDRMYQVRVLPPQLTIPPKLPRFDFPDPIRQSTFSSSFSSIHTSHLQISSSFDFLSPPPPFLKRTKPPISLGQGPFQRIHHPRMSTTTSAASAPKLEKKPVKFSNLLLGAGLNLFEVTSLGQVWHYFQSLSKQGKLTIPPSRWR